MALSRKRSSDANESDGGSTVKKPKTTTSKPKKGKDVGTCSLTKKEIGDRVKESLALQKYHIPQSHFQMDMDVLFFRSFFVDNASLTSPLTVVPETFDESTPVVVIEMDKQAAGEILGVSKVKGGNRYVTMTVSRMCVVFRPKEGNCSIWSSV